MQKKITRLLYTYITLGADENTTKNELKKILLLHVFCNIWHLLTLLNLISKFDSVKGFILIIVPLCITCLIVAVQVLQYFKWFLTARVLFIFNIQITIFALANFLIKMELLEYNFLLAPAVSLVLINNKKINIAILAISFFLFFIPNYFFEHYPITMFNNVGVFALFVCVYIVVSYFKSLNIKNEKILEAKTKELEELDRFKSQFFTNISHEIRTPLTLINAQVSDLEKFTSAVPDIAIIKNNIEKQINNITNMVDDVLNLAKMQSSNFNLQLKNSNISELIKRLGINFEPLFKQKGINFRVLPNTETFTVKIDTVFLERAINNIIINAFKYTYEGKVVISLTEKNQFIHITISDTGIGISKNELSSVFNRFYQVNNDINEAGGSGVGLAFSKEIVELHGGKLSLESEPNVGSVFTVILPLEKNQTVVDELYTESIEIEKKPTLSKSKKLSEKTILVVDDNYDMRQYLLSILQNYNCVEASNGFEALKIIEQKPIDFIVTDYMMPKLNGYELVVKLKENNVAAPIIMLTAKADNTTKLNVLKLGVDDYLTKPFKKEELLIRIENCLRNHSTRNDYNNEHDININEYTDGFIIQLKEYIYEKAHDTKLNQDIIVEEFKHSKSTIYRRIKSETGLSPNNFIKEIRLLKAKEILNEKPHILLKQLALEVGFSHVNYFSKIYLERFGCKPPIKK